MRDVYLQGMTLLMMGSADELPAEPSEKPMFMEDMTEQELASAVSDFIAYCSNLKSLSKININKNQNDTDCKKIHERPCDDMVSHVFSYNLYHSGFYLYLFLNGMVLIN